MGWSVVSNDEKQQHQLFDKKSAVEWFFTGLTVCGIFSLLASIGQLSAFTSQLNSGMKVLVAIGALAQPIFILIMCNLFKANKKSKKGAIITWVLILLLPFINLAGIILIRMQGSGLNVGFESAIGMFVLCILFATVYGIYSFISPVFRLQYCNQIKM